MIAMEEQPTILKVESRKKYYVIGAIVLLLAVLTLFLAVGKQFGFVGKSYSQVYSLVDDKISQSAAVIVNLPKGVSKAGAEKLVSFEPPLKGEWASAVNLRDALAFVPKDPLEIGKRYTVKFAMAEGSISKDFVIDEDPKVIEVFPRPDSETAESSSITIMFNRPMVPLTALSELEQKDVAVQITPATEGKFKWISTRTLQFIPKAGLAYSAHYSVKILPGFASTDGVPVPKAEYQFATRPLKFENVTQGVILYDQPIQFSFNEPIDLERTSREVRLINNRTGAQESFAAEYGKRYRYDKDGKPVEVVVDRSILSVFAKADLNGRSKIWNFGGSYTVSLDKAYPLGGDINFSGHIGTTVTITEVIKTLVASTEKSKTLSLYIFDPRGEVVANFYEDIDLGKTEISAKGLVGVNYGKKCSEAGSFFGSWKSSNDSCEKIDDKSQIILTFNPSLFGRGELVPIKFKKIVNADGLTINGEPLIKNVNTYPELKILSISPKTGETQAGLTNLYICTNTPLSPKDKTNYKEAIQSKQYLVFNRWENSYLREADQPKYPSNIPCNPGEYVNSIRYGLHPETNYSVGLSLEDIFGQKITSSLAFTTGRAPEFYSRFFSLQKIYNVTTPDKTKFTYAVENLEYVNLLICKVSPATMLSYLDNRPEATDSDDTLNCITTRTATIDLPKVYWVNNYFQIDLKEYLDNPLGQYVLSFSNPNYVENYSRDGGVKRRIYDRTYVSVTNLAVGEKKTQWTRYDNLADMTQTAFNTSGAFANLYWVSNANSLNPIAGATVRIYQRTGDYNGPIVAGVSATSGENGVAEIPLSKDIVGAVVTVGDDSAIVSSWTDNLSWAGSVWSDRMVYAYTDRPIYRPGQDVYIKGIYRFRFDGNYKIFEDKEVLVEIYDAKNALISSQQVPLSDFGTFVTHLKLASDASLGTYRFEALDNSFFFDVAEYQGAAFEATAIADKDEYVAGETAKISTIGKYYFGVPLAGGKLNYSWTAQDYYFDRYTDEYFNFGRDWYYCQDCGYGDSYIGNGEASLDASGKAEVTQNFDFAKLFKSDTGNRSKIVVFHGTITDLNGKSVSFQKSFIVHRGDFYLGVKAEPSFVGAGESLNIRLKTVDISGAPISANNLNLTASKVEWKSAKRQEVDGGYYNNYSRELTKVETRNLSTGRGGDGEVTLSFKDPGEYEISVSSTDRRGNLIIADTGLYVYGAGTASVQPKNNESLDVTAEKANFEVGERAKIIIKSPYTRAKAMISIERGGIFKYEIVNIDKNFYEYEIPIEENYAPNVFVSVLMLGSNPAVKFGQVQLKVNTARKALKIDVVTDKQ